MTLIDNHEEARNLLFQFSKAMDPDELRKTYGTNWPRAPIPRERFYLFTDARTDERVAWGMIRMDEVDAFFHRLIGVWPHYQGRGLVKDIADMITHAGFEEWPSAEGCMSMVLNTNPYQDKRLKAMSDGRMVNIFAGKVFFPEPGHVLFWLSKEKFYGERDARNLAIKASAWGSYYGAAGWY